MKPGTTRGPVGEECDAAAAAEVRPEEEGEEDEDKETDKTHVQDSPADPLSSVVDAQKGILAKLSPADQAAVSGFLTSELGSPAVSEKRRRPAPSTAETKAN